MENCFSIANSHALTHSLTHSLTRALTHSLTRVPPPPSLSLSLSLSGVLAVSGGRFPAGYGAINMDDLECRGNETSLFDCPFNENSKCGHGEDAGVFCGVTLGEKRVKHCSE